MDLIISLSPENKKRLVCLTQFFVGHTHRPRFPKAGDIAYFNDGSCVHPRSITGIEIASGEISLIKWEISTKEDGTLQIVKTVLEGPEKLLDFKTEKIN